MKKTVRRLCLLLLFSIVLVGSVSNEAHAEHKNITLNGEWVSGSLKEDVCFYKFTLTKAGLVSFTFQSYSDRGKVALRDADLKTEYSYIEFYSASTTSPATSTAEKWLDKGTYYLEVCCYGRFDAWTGDYRLKASFTAANNNETEPNDAFATAMALDKNKMITGLLWTDDELDFYKFTITSGQTVNIIYNVDNVEQRYLGHKVEFSLWNVDYLCIKDMWAYSNGEWEMYLQPGTYYIKIAHCGNDGTYNIKWTSKQYVSSIKMKGSKVTMSKGGTYNVLSAVYPSDATNKTLKWESSNTSVATVNSAGTVTARQTGSTVITATSTDGSEVVSKCTVIVKPQKIKIVKLSHYKYFGKTYGRQITVKLSNPSGISGYQVAYSKNKNFSKKSTYRTYYTTTTTKKLAKNKKYYFKARAYFIYDNTYYYGAWSSVKTIKTKKK